VATPSVWSRARDFVGRLFRPKPPERGRFVAGRKFAWRGWLAAAAWVWPARDYLAYLPTGHSRWKRRPLIVLIHGCRQTPEELATGTCISVLADRNGWLILLSRDQESQSVELRELV
jgi:hypothetical protein